MSFDKEYQKARSSASSSASKKQTARDAAFARTYLAPAGVKNVLKKLTLNVDDSFINSYINDVNSFGIDEDLTDLDYTSAKQAYKKYSDRIYDLRQRGGKVLAYLDQNVKLMNPEAYHTLKDQIVSVQNSFAEQMGALNEWNHYYSQWDTEDAYNRAMQESSWAQKYQGKGYRDLVPLLESLEDGDEKNWLTEYAKAVDYDEHVNMDLDAERLEIQNMEKLLKDARFLELEYNSFRENPLLILTQGDTWRNLESRYDSFLQEYGSVEKLQKDLDQRRLRMEDAKKLQDSIRAEEEYEAWTKTVRDTASIQKDLDALNAKIEPIEARLKEENKKMRGGIADVSLESGTGAEAEGMTASGNMKQIQETRKMLQELEQQRAALEQELQYRQKLEYAALMQRPDFEKNSLYIPTGEGNAIRDNATGMYVDTGFEDIEYDYINKNEKAKNYQLTIDSLSNINRMGMDRGWLHQMTDDEVAVYNYLYKTEGKEAASKYLDVMRSELNSRQRTAEQVEWAEKAKANPGATSLATVAFAPLKAAGLVGQAIDYAADGKIDQNAAYNRISNISTAIRDEVSKIAQEKWGGVGSFGYQTAMSMGDFLMNGLAGGGLFGVPGVTMAIMGSGAAADTVISAKDRGLEDAEAFSLGIVAGLAEALTERFSLEALLDADLLKNGIGVYMLKNSLTEGSEEVASSIINLTADILVSKEKSEWKQAIRNYQDQGYSEDEAFAKALAEQAAIMGMDFVGGMLSGGIMSGVTSAQYKASTTRQGKALGRRGLTDVQEIQQILDAGASAQRGSEANAVAARIQKKIDAGQRLSAYDKGQLYQSNPQMVGEAVFGKGSVQLANTWVKGIDNKHEDWKQAQRLATITGRDIRFYNGDPEEDGYYNRKTGEIFINVDRASEHQAAYVFSHELTHSTELGDSYANLRDYIKEKLIAEGRDWNLMMRNKAEAYANAGHALESDADIEAEIVAQYVQDTLLSNEQELYDLFWTEPTIGQKIVKWFDNILAKFPNGEKARERLYIEEARKKVLRAWESSNRARMQSEQKRQTSGKKVHETTEKVQYSPENLDAMDRMYQEQFNRGEITEEEYDEYLAWREHEAAAEDGEAELKRQYSFAGPKAKTADIQKLQQAKQMQTEGVANETIRQQTGWFQGMDGKWRFEIDDSRLKYHRAGDALFSEMHPEYVRHQELMQKWLYGELDGKEETEFRELDEVWGREHQRLSDRVRRGNATLQNILRHDELFEAYPEIRGAKVIFEDMEDGKRGQYDPNTNTITLSNTLRNAPQETLLHEVQHAIQSVENFTGGASVEYWKEKRRDIVETIAAAIKNLDLWLADIGYPEVNKRSLLEVSRREKTLEQHWKDMKEFKEKSEFAQHIAACEAEIAEFQKQYDEITNGMTAYEQYENTAGEIEARDTANRWKIGLDAEGRKNTPPDLGDDKTVFAEGNARSYSLTEYTEHQKRNWETSKRIVVYNNEQQLSQFIHDSIVNKTMDKKMYFGAIPSDLAARIIADTGLNVESYNLSLGSYEIRKILKDHGDEKKEVPRGQRAVTANDFAHVVDVVLNPDKITLSEEKYMGKPAIVFIGENNGRMNVVAVVSDKRLDLFVQTIYVNVKKGNLATPMDDQASINTPEANSGTVSSSISISDGQEDVNRKYSLRTSTVNKRDVARDLRAILSRGGDPRELQRYVNSLEQTSRNAEQTGANRYQIGEKRYQNGENRNSTAREILQAAHSRGQSVEEYLRWNPEQFERDGKWRPEALEAMRMEQENGRQYSLNTVNPYRGAILSEDGHVYTYNFLTRLPDMQTVMLSDITDIRDENNRIDTAKVIELGRKNALSVGAERGGEIFVTNRYTGRELKITNASIRHGLEGSMNRLLTNARLGSVIGEVVQNAVPINALHNKAQGVEGTYAMAGYATDTDGRKFVAIITVEQRSGTVEGVDVYDLTHAVSGRQKKRQPVGHEVPGNYPPSVASKISIEDFLPIVKDVYQSILPQDVLDHLGESRSPMGHYSDKVKFSLNDGTERKETTESQAHGISRENLPTKAQNYLRRTERTLLNRIGEALSVPRYARYNSLKEIIQEISNAYLQEGTISDEKLTELFDKAYAAGIVTDAEFYNQYKEIKDHLRTYGVTISDRDKGDIPDFNDFRKRAMGTLRIVNEGGVPVDTAYQELRTMAPELFPDNITHPADQLMRMYEVGQSIAVSQKNLDEYYGHSETEREEFRRWAKNDFDAAVGDSFRDLKLVKRYAEEQSEEVEAKKILTTEDAEKAFEELKKLRRNVDKVTAKNLLSESDKILLGRMLKGEIGPQHLNPREDNVQGIMAVYEAKLAYESQCEVLAAYKKSIRAKRLYEADQHLETARTWKDKKAGILYARETMRRNIMDIVPDRKVAEKIAEFFFESVHIAEAKSTKFKNEYRERVRALNLSTKVQKGNLVSEAHAVQLLGEAMDNIRVMENSRGNIWNRDGKTLSEWRAVVDDLWMNNTGLDRKKIENAVQEFRKIYDELFQQMNRVRVENGYEPVNYRQGYFPHFQPGGDGIMAFFGKAMGINTQVDSLPTTINGLTHTFKPGIQWFGNAQERLGFNTAYDAVEGFDKYIEGVASVIYQTENIQKLRALATQVRYRTTDEGIRKQVDFIRMDNRLTEEEKQREINAIYEHGKFSLSNFVAELDEYTNLLANKKSKYDRTMESLIGRRAYTLMKNWENRVGANMIAGNISSAMTNFIPLTQAGAQLDSGLILKGMFDTLKNMRQEDGLVGMSDFLTNRRGSDPLVKNWAQKASGILGAPMELIDNFTSEAIVRAAYLQNLKRGLSEAEAMHQADIFTSGVMADRSKGAMPTLFESRNPLFKAFTQFQLEVNNQFSEIFKDLPRNHREKGLAVLAMILLKYFLGAWMYNELFEKLIGRRSALDPFDMLNQTVGDLTGYEIPNLFDMASDWMHGEEISFETEKVGIGEAGSNLATSVLSELPFSAGLNLFGVETDGGRLPAASAVPDLSAIWDAATNGELTGDQRWKKLQDELNKLAYVLPPFGGGQIGKSWKGIKAYLEGGSYSLDKDGDKILQYPVYKDDPDDAFWSLVRAALMGKNSLPEAQDWMEQGYNSLNQYETVVYKDLLDCGVKDRDAFALVDQLRKVDETETEEGARRAEGRRILAKSDISADGKAAAFYGMVASSKEREWMDELVDAGAEQADTMAFVSNLYDADKLKGTEKKQEQLRVFLDAPLTEEEKKTAVGFIMDTDLETESGNPTQYAKFLTALSTGLTVDKYMELRANGTDIEDYLELTDVGIKGDKAADLSIDMATLEPEDGYDNVSWIQRCRTVMDSKLTEQEKLKALQTVDGMYESTYEKIVTGHNLGMNVKSYIDLKSIMPKYDANGNGSYTQAETEAAINALAGDDNVLFALTGTTPNGYTLTDREKAILWQLQNKSWKPNRNPFDREVGQMVYDILTAEGSADAATYEGVNGFDVGSLLALVK